MNIRASYHRFHGFAEQNAIAVKSNGQTAKSDIFKLVISSLTYTLIPFSLSIQINESSEKTLYIVTNPASFPSLNSTFAIHKLWPLIWNWI